ncbi:MAG: hypothetical protein DRO67_06050 [Candidatus Asgardarchaeum californiense]|nr:MAG: hypothetical protein DRO67_06050 [Candidatus Asgardarchaeum californiense]
MTERKITIGTDPEYFMRNKKTQELVSAIPFIKGDKQKPIPLKHGGNVQSDNVAVEFATDPAKSTKEFINNIKAAFGDTMDSIPKEFELVALPSAEFSDEELKDPKALEFGCMPDYCAWKLEQNTAPQHPNPNFRSCGGHVHVGCMDADEKMIHKDTEFLLEHEGKVLTIRGMDLFHGIISTILDNSKEAIERRTLYGKAGCHRPTEYGVEYRALSNYWTKTPYSSMLISSLTDVVIDLIIEDKLEAIIEEVSPEEIQRIINTGNEKDAKSILDKVLINYLNEDSKFYLDECLAKLDKAGTITKEWALEA